MSKSSRAKFRQFVIWNIHKVVFLIVFVCLLLLFCWSLCCRCYSWFLLLVFLCSFLCIFQVLLSIDPHYLHYWRVFFRLHFLTRIFCLRLLWDVRSYASSLVFLFPSLFVEVLPSSISRMFPNISQGGLLWCLSWWDSCYRFWFRDFFSRLPEVLFFSFFLSSQLVWWCNAPNIPKYF